MAEPSNLQTNLVKKLPDELLRDILRQATFLPHEWDVSATSTFPGLFCSWDQLQIGAWETVLPYRVALSCVSRRWRAVALEFLYATFHDRRNDSLASFASLLSVRPYYGTLVRRLTVWHAARDDAEGEALVTMILQRCPNLLIFSFTDHHRHDLQPSPLLSYAPIFPATLKQLDGRVDDGLPIGAISELLAQLPQLEILMLTGIEGTLPYTNSTKIVLPNLRMLQLSFSIEDSRYIHKFILSLELPLLKAMCIEVYSVAHIPNDLAERLEYLELSYIHNKIGVWEANKFPNLSRLRLDFHQLHSPDVRSILPLNQIVELACSIPPLTYEARSIGEDSILGQVMNILLDTSTLPKLRVLILNIGEGNWNQVKARQREFQWVSAYFESLAASFDQRGIDLWFEPPHMQEESVLARDMIKKSTT
jgi:hypothetical protein